MFSDSFWKVSSLLETLQRPPKTLEEPNKGGKGSIKEKTTVEHIQSTSSNFLTYLVVTITLCTPGEAEKPCVLSLVDDTLYEEGERLRLVLGSPKSESQFGASVGALSETLVKIKDTTDSK